MSTASLIYTSQSIQPVTGQSLEELAAVSSSNNSKIGVTGLLLYGSGHFLQVLEGKSFSIRQLYQRICFDPRHNQCELLFENQRERRLFPLWNMGVLNLDNPGEEHSNGWELICMALSQAGAMDWDKADPVVGWIRQFIAHNGAGSAA